MSYDSVLFDLGGVLAEYRGVARMLVLADIQDESDLWRRWLNCEWVRSFERGRCTPEEFARGMVDDWRLDVDPDAFLAEFSGWVLGPFEGADQLVAAVAAEVPVSCLSNTNQLHWQGQMAHWQLLGRFEHTFLSFNLGMVKPDREIFEHVVEQLDAPPDRVLFLDDNALNVEAATGFGLCAIRVRGVDEAKDALQRLGVLTLAK